MQAFVEAVDKHLQNGVLDTAYNRVMDAVWRNPGDLGAAAREAADLVSKIDVSGPAEKAGQRWTPVDGLIKDLMLPWRGDAAARTLAGMDLSTAELEAVTKLFPPRGSTSPRTDSALYAAYAVNNSVSPHRTQNQLSRAQEVCTCQP